MVAIHKQHHDRAAIQAEAHARPPMAMETEKVEAWHWVLFNQPGTDEPWPEVFDHSSRHQVVKHADGVLRYERHTEFYTLTFFGDRAPDPDTLSIIRAHPGRQFAGARVVVSGLPNLKGYFGDGRLFGGSVLLESVTVATDFKINDDGLVVFAVSGLFEDAYARGDLIKLLLDLETYRMASLLALPLVRQSAKELEQLEKGAIEATSSLSDDTNDLEQATRDFSNILKKIARLKSKTAYRIAAARAYDDIVASRLANLNETPIGQRQTLKGFIEHRLRPGINSITAFQNRADRVASSVSDALALVRTQLDQASQRQSEALLVSMEKRARQQVHLAQAVEGLSVAAITYYAVGLVGTIVKAFPYISSYAPLFQALSIPIIAFLVWWNVRKAKKLISEL